MNKLRCKRESQTNKSKDRSGVTTDRPIPASGLQVPVGVLKPARQREARGTRIRIITRGGKKKEKKRKTVISKNNLAGIRLVIK